LISKILKTLCRPYAKEKGPRVIPTDGSIDSDSDSSGLACAEDWDAGRHSSSLWAVPADQRPGQSLRGATAVHLRGLIEIGNFLRPRLPANCGLAGPAKQRRSIAIRMTGGKDRRPAGPRRRSEFGLTARSVLQAGEDTAFSH